MGKETHLLILFRLTPQIPLPQTTIIVKLRLPLEHHPQTPRHAPCHHAIHISALADDSLLLDQQLVDHLCDLLPINVVAEVGVAIESLVERSRNA